LRSQGSATWRWFRHRSRNGFPMHLGRRTANFAHERVPNCATKCTIVSSSWRIHEPLTSDGSTTLLQRSDIRCAVFPGNWTASPLQSARSPACRNILEPKNELTLPSNLLGPWGFRNSGQNQLLKRVSRPTRALAEDARWRLRSQRRVTSDGGESFPITAGFCRVFRCHFRVWDDCVAPRGNPSGGHDSFIPTPTGLMREDWRRNVWPRDSILFRMGISR